MCIHIFAVRCSKCTLLFNFECGMCNVLEIHFKQTSDNNCTDEVQKTLTRWSELLFRYLLSFALYPFICQTKEANINVSTNSLCYYNFLSENTLFTQVSKVSPLIQELLRVKGERSTKQVTNQKNNNFQG